MPLASTPSHPEYPAAHGCLTGAVTKLIATYFHTSKLPISVDSLSFKDGVHTHTFTNTDDFLSEVQWARIYAGFHYYHSVVDGAELGQKVAEHLAGHYFRPGRFERD